MTSNELYACIGMNAEGIYRVSGHAQDVISIKEKFDKGIQCK